MTYFIGVAFAALENKLVCIATSEGYSAVEMEGFSSREALRVLYSIADVREEVINERGPGESKPVLVMYESAVDLELIFQEISIAKKDILFGLYRASEDQVKDTPLFDNRTPEYRGQVDVFGLRIAALPGKVLRLGKLVKGPKGKPDYSRGGIAFYDIAGFCDCSDVNEAAKTFLTGAGGGKGEGIEKIEKNLLPLWKENLTEKILDRCEAEAKLIVKLAEKVNKTVAPLDLGMRQWYGPSAIAARCLHKWQARRQSKRLTERNSPYELIRAIDCAYFGGRVEALKLGTIPDVRTYDLNSAYAYATT